jgi:DNA-binding NarL/FixJ family response regulator
VDETGKEAIRVLIIDDHRMFAESLSRLLSDEEDIDVVGVATSGTEGIELAARLQPVVVLLDYHMPDQDGVVVAAEIKQRTPDTMIVILTGAPEDRVLLSAIEAGCSGFMTKDRASEEVAEAVRVAAAGEALISPAMLARLLPKLNRTHRSLGDDLTDREREILGYLVRGYPNKTIATELFLSVNTIRNYVQSILGKLGAHSKLEAVSTAVRQGIIDYSS